ncbi:MAG: hypothetical protein ACQET5_14460 [Halobacteriota archaeon]
MGTQRNANDARMWRRVVLITVLFLSAVVISGALLILLRGLFASP